MVFISYEKMICHKKNSENHSELKNKNAKKEREIS